MITPMASVEIAGPLPLFDRSVEAIQEAGLVHLEEIPLLEDAERPSLHRIRLTEAQEADRQSLEETLRLLDEGVARMPPPLLAELRGSPQLAVEYRRWERESPSTVASAVRVLHAKVRSQIRRERNLSDDLRALSVYEEVTAALAPLVETTTLPASSSSAWSSRRRPTWRPACWNRRSARSRAGAAAASSPASAAAGWPRCWGSLPTTARPCGRSWSARG